MDIATVKKLVNLDVSVTKPNWCIIVDECTQLKFSNFFDRKNGMVEPTCEKINKWKQKGIVVKYVRLDNAGENKLLMKRSNSSDWKLGLEYEFTACDTPQQDHLAELGFATVANRG